MWQRPHHTLTRKQRQLRRLSRQSRGAWALLAALLAAIWGGAAGIAWWMTTKASASDRLPAVDLQASQDFIYDLRKLEPGQSRFFTYPTSSTERSKLWLNRYSYGVLRAAFATCTTCYSYRKQHSLKEGEFICGRCRSAMTIGGRNERMTLDKGCVAGTCSVFYRAQQGNRAGQAIMEGAKTLTEAVAKTANRADAGSNLFAHFP